MVMLTENLMSAEELVNVPLNKSGHYITNQIKILE